MNRTAFKEFIKTPKGKLVLALAVMFLSWIFLFLNFSNSLMISLPSQARKAEIKQEIRKLRTELQNLNEKKMQAEKQKKRWSELAAKSWQPNRDGDPELLLRQMIENAARKSELKLNNLGTVRINRVNQDFYFAELDVSSTTRIAPLIAFVHAIQQAKPGISWRRFSVYVMMRRPRNNSRTVSSNTADDNLIFSGNLRTLVYNPENNGSKTASAVRNTPVRESKNDRDSAVPNRPGPPMSPEGTPPMPGGKPPEGGPGRP